MSIRGASAIVGIGEIPTKRVMPRRTDIGLLGEVTKMALDDAHFQKSDINGLITSEGSRNGLVKYIGINPPFAMGVALAAASGAATIQLAAAAITTGYCDTLPCAISGTARWRWSSWAEYGQ
jgi:acetyl-CoA acetyltransferase